MTIQVPQNLQDTVKVDFKSINDFLQTLVDTVTALEKRIEELENVK